MKRSIGLVLVCVLLTGLCACNNAAAPETTEATDAVARDPNMPKKLYAAELAAVPLATNDVTKAELQQLCLDFFVLQPSFQWKTDMDFPSPRLTAAPVTRLSPRIIFR